MKKTIRTMLKKHRQQLGASSVEYALLVALIALVIIATTVLLGQQVEASFCTFLTNFGAPCP